jgi:hypothetical protein
MGAARRRARFVSGEPRLAAPPPLARAHPPGVLHGIEARAGRPEYARLLEEVRGLYCTARQQLIAPFVSARLATLAGADLPGLLRGGAEQLLRTAQLEAQLYEQLLGGEGAARGGGGGKQGARGRAQPQARARARHGLGVGSGCTL